MGDGGYSAVPRYFGRHPDGVGGNGCSAPDDAAVLHHGRAAGCAADARERRGLSRHERRRGDSLDRPGSGGNGRAADRDWLAAFRVGHERVGGRDRGRDQRDPCRGNGSHRSDWGWHHGRYGGRRSRGGSGGGWSDRSYRGDGGRDNRSNGRHGRNGYGGVCWSGWSYGCHGGDGGGNDGGDWRCGRGGSNRGDRRDRRGDDRCNWSGGGRWSDGRHWRYRHYRRSRGRWRNRCNGGHGHSGSGRSHGRTGRRGSHRSYGRDRDIGIRWSSRGDGRGGCYGGRRRGGCNRRHGSHGNGRSRRGDRSRRSSRCDRGNGRNRCLRRARHDPVHVLDDDNRLRSGSREPASVERNPERSRHDQGRSSFL